MEGLVPRDISERAQSAQVFRREVRGGSTVASLWMEVGTVAHGPLDVPTTGSDWVGSLIRVVPSASTGTANVELKSSADPVFDPPLNDPVTDLLRRYQWIGDMVSIAEALRAHPGHVSLFFEALPVVKEFFPNIERSVLRIIVDHDDPSFWQFAVQLVCSGSIEQAFHFLDRFDREWWALRSLEFDPGIIFDVGVP